MSAVVEIDSNDSVFSHCADVHPPFEFRIPDWFPGCEEARKAGLLTEPPLRTSAQAVQLLKACFFGDHPLVYELTNPRLTGKNAIRLGARVRSSDEALEHAWESALPDAVLLAVSQKFVSGPPKLTTRLLATHSCALVEAPTGCAGSKPPQVAPTDKNTLGEALMRVRDERRNARLFLSAHPIDDID